MMNLGLFLCFFKKNLGNVWWNKKNVVPLHRNSEMSCNLNKRLLQ